MIARSDTIRGFVALPCPTGIREAIGEVLPEWCDLGGRVRWTPPERVHLTLRFLGDSAPDQIASVRRGLRGIAEESDPLEVRPTEVGAFPHWGRPRVVWLGVDGGEPLFRLATRVEEVALSAGFEAEDRNFRPHLTLARVKGRRGVKRVARAVRAWRCPEESEIVDEMILFESELRSDGARHVPIERFPLRGRT